MLDEGMITEERKIELDKFSEIANITCYEGYLEIEFESTEGSQFFQKENLVHGKNC
jgi:hypothetical protein